MNRKGLEVHLPRSYDRLRKEAEDTLHKVLDQYPRAMTVCDLMINDPEVNGCWDVSNYIAVSKLHYSDHGEVHAKIVAANAVKMLSLLAKKGIVPDLQKHAQGYTLEDSFVVVLCAALLHDIGNQVDRTNHNLFSTFLAIPILNRVLTPIPYNSMEIMAEVRGFILHAIYTHTANIPDYSIEAALVGLADGTDLTKGRGRLAFDLGSAGIHTVSALAVENVKVTAGTDRPIKIVVEMSNSAGIFQVEQTLVQKITKGPLEDHVEIIALAVPEGFSDKRIIHRLVVEKGKLVAKDI